MIHHIDHGPYHNDFDKVLNFYGGLKESLIDIKSYGIEMKNSLESFDTLIIFKRDSLKDFDKSLKELNIEQISLDIESKIPERNIRNVTVKFNYEYWFPSGNYKDYEQIVMLKLNDYENARSFLIYLSKMIPNFTFFAFSRLEDNECMRLNKNKYESYRNSR